jgi:CheY-like chemotaxis protein
MGVTDGAPPPESPTSVLVVEDDFLLREATVDTLNDLGYRAISACDAGQALAAIDLFPEIKVLLADIGLPIMNGLELAAEARRRRPDLGVLFVTGYARPGRFGVPSPGDIYLLKPCTPADLANALQQLVNATPVPAGGDGPGQSATSAGRADPSVATGARSVLTQP